ncbi:hypothetical protein SZN_09141 [Streptomyces zinciresistens K42]|uniref:Uncharacterized protein n=1 Tax=Streptomyces zinciresistens K42 TaxID=700597 RepID=G2G8L0_9ACTN|nr:hypothetical protein SZN_09141 [Streptomyces zinciresistens K42]
MHPGFVTAVEMLTMPPVCDLPEDRRSGDRCAYCGGVPDVDLGIRLSVLRGEVQVWRPKSCEPCARSRAREVFRGHVDTCARCCGADYCVDARAVHGLGWP